MPEGVGTHPPRHGIQRATVGKWVVHILLECFLVIIDIILVIEIDGSFVLSRSLLAHTSVLSCRNAQTVPACGITARQTSCGKVMFSRASVSHSVQGLGGNP